MPIKLAGIVVDSDQEPNYTPLTTERTPTARLQKEVVVTKDGPQVITRFPAEELIIAGRRYHAAAGPLSATRESQSHLNRSADGIPVGIAGVHSRGP